jgi:RNA polymerase sigma-70 factor (ECF subfamily)
MIWWRKRAHVVSDDPAPNLMERYCAGDANAFRDLYALLAPGVLDDLADRGCQGDEAVQVLEAAFLALHRDRGSYVVGADPRPWLLALARCQESALARQRAPRASTQPQPVSA